MIQRIQSLYLLLAAVVLGTSAALVCTMSLFVIVLSLTGLLSLTTIFLYRKRMLQLRLVAFTLFLEVIASAVVTWQEGVAFWQAHLLVGLLLIVAFIFGVLARAGIARDERLVRSADRLR